MVENEKLINEENKLPENILSDTVETTDIIPEETITTESEIKIEEPETITTESEIKVEEPKEIKVADVSVDSFNKEQKKDFNRLLELKVDVEDAKKIILGEEVEIKKTDFEQSEFEVEKSILKEEGRDLELSIKAQEKAETISQEVFVDDVGIETKGGFLDKKTLFEMNGYSASKDDEIDGDIRFKLGFGLDGIQFKENNIKNLLINRIAKTGKYSADTLAKHAKNIQVKEVLLKSDGKDKTGLVYRIPKDLGGDNMFKAVDSPKLTLSDVSDAAADSAPIVASIIGGTFGSALGPLGTVAGSAVSAGLTEMARLMYGYHKLGLQKDLYSPDEFFEVAFNASVKYAAIDAAATGVFLTGAKLILPTLLGKSQLSTSTIKEFIETEGKTNTTIFKEVNKVKEQMKKEFNFNQTEVDNYFAVSIGKAILNSDQLVKKGSAAQRALLSDEVVRLETTSAFKALEQKILKQTTGLSEVGSKQADDIILNIQKQVKGQADVALREAELTLLTNTKQITKLESSFIDDLSVKYLDDFGVTLDDAYKNIQSRLAVLDDELAAGILKNTNKMDFNVSDAINIINKEMKFFKFKKGLFPTKLKVAGKKATEATKAKIASSNKLFKIAQELDKGGLRATGSSMKVIKEGLEELQKSGNITLKDAYTIKNAVNLLIETAEGPYKGQLMQVSKGINDNISEQLIKSGDEKLAKQFVDRHNLLELKRGSFFNNFSKEFGHSINPAGVTNLKFSSNRLFNKIINNTDAAREEAASLSLLIKNGIVPDATVNNIKQALYKNYFNKVIPGVDGVSKMTHKEFFEQFGKNYKALLGKDYNKLFNTKSVLKAYDNSMAAVADINGTVAKFLPGIENWSALSNAGPGEIVEHILKPEFAKTMNLTKLLQALPTKTVSEIRTLFLSRMMKQVANTGDFVPNFGTKILGGKTTGTLNGKALNTFLDKNRSTVLQMFDANFFSVYRSMGEVLEMLQVPIGSAAAKDTSMAAASKNAALFIDMIYGPLNHKRLILNRASRLLDSFGMTQDNLALFTDYGMFVEAAKKNFLAGNYPAWIGKLPEKERGLFISKTLNAINKTVDFINLGFIGGGFNRKAGLRETFNLLPKKGNRLAPLKNPVVQKEYLEDKYEEMTNDDNMQQDADMFFPIDVGGKYAIKTLKAVFGSIADGIKWVGDKKGKADMEEERDIKKEKFDKIIN